MVKICLDPGHGGRTPGAVNKYCEEKDINLILAKKLAQRIEEDLQEHEVVLTRDSDVFLKLMDRCMIANVNACDIFVSLHCNSSTNICARGVEVFYFNNSLKGKQLAQFVQNEIINKVGAKYDRGIKGTDKFVVLNHTAMPAILIEVGFLSNDDDSCNLMSDDYQNLLAFCIKNGIALYLQNC